VLLVGLEEDAVAGTDDLDRELRVICTVVLLGGVRDAAAS
jgi:hypothetical protein